MRWIKLPALILLCGALAVAQDVPNSPPDAAAQPMPANDEEPAEEPKLPKLSEMKVPTAEELLQGKPLDWIVLKGTEEVIVTLPVYPRPNTLARMEQAIEESKDWPRPNSPEALEEFKQKREDLFYLNLILPDGGENPEYRLHMKHVDRIILHEDQMLLRVDEFVKEGKLRQAFELLFLLARREPDWPGLAERQNDILFAEARRAFEQGRLESALLHVTTLHGRDPQYAGLSETLGEAGEALMSRAVEQEDFREARHFLERVRRLEPGHPVVAKWDADLLARAQSLIAAAEEQSSGGDHAAAAEAVTRAARVWPQTPGLRDVHRRLTGRWQELRVGVVDLPGGPTACPVAAPADERQRRLVESSL
ncbi:MAG: tetratricopeptide repeat protein, partial [Planctomycetaceae bacterium]